jgi:hypothetical protein
MSEGRIQVCYLACPASSQCCLSPMHALHLLVVYFCRLGVTQPQYRCWLPLSKIGETMAILHIMRCNLSLDRGDLAQSVHDAQAAVALTIIPGSSACSPKAMSAMWFAQACRALGRVSVVRSCLLPSHSGTMRAAHMTHKVVLRACLTPRRSVQPPLSTEKWKHATALAAVVFRATQCMCGKQLPHEQG